MSGRQKAPGWADNGLDVEFAVEDVLLFADTIEELIVAVGHNHMHTNEVVNGTEATSREVTLWQYSALTMVNPNTFNRNKHTLYWTGS